MSPLGDWAFWSLISVLPFVNYPSQMLGHGPSRHLYFASAGASFVLAWVMRTGVQKVVKKHRAVTLTILAGGLVILSWDALKRAEAHTLYRSGKGYIARGDLASGNDQLIRAISRDPSLIPVDAYERFAITSFAMGKPATKKLL
jgi:hypothetical protein